MCFFSRVGGQPAQARQEFPGRARCPSTDAFAGAGMAAWLVSRLGAKFTL